MSKIVLWAKAFSKDDVIAAIELVTDVKLPQGCMDSAIIREINKLSDADETRLKELLTPLSE